MGCTKCGAPTPNKRLCNMCQMMDREHEDAIGDGGEAVERPPDEQGDQVRIGVFVGPGPEVAVDELPPVRVLDAYPNEKKSDDPKMAFFSDLSSTVADSIGPALDEIEIDTTVGELVVDGRSWSFEPAAVDALELEPFEGPTWSLECQKCGFEKGFSGRSRYKDCHECGDVAAPHRIVGITGSHDSPPFAPIFENDVVGVELAETDRVLKGRVSEVSDGGWDSPEHGARAVVYLRDVDECPGGVVLEADREHAGVDWGDVAAIDLGEDYGPDDRVELGTVTDVDVLERPRSEQDDAEDGKSPQADDQAMSHADADADADADDAPDPEVMSAIADLADELGVRFNQAEEVLEDVFGTDLETALPRSDGGDGDGPVDIEAAVREAVKQGDPDVVEKRVDERADELEALGLSGREAEVVAWKEQGFTHAEIADRVEFSRSSVDEYSRRARAKKRDARDEIDRLEALVDELDETFPTDS